MCGRFASKPSNSGSAACSGRLHRQFTRFGTRKIRRFVLSLHCGNNNLIASTRLLTRLLTPGSTLKRVFYGLGCGSGRSGAIACQLSGASRGLSLPHLFVLANDEATSTSRTIVGKLHPFCGMCLLKRRARNGGIKSVALADSGCSCRLRPVIYGVSGTRKGSRCGSNFVPS